MRSHLRVLLILVLAPLVIFATFLRHGLDYGLNAFDRMLEHD